MSKKIHKCTEEKPFTRLAVDTMTTEQHEKVKKAIRDSRLTRPAFYKKAILAASRMTSND